MTIGRILELWAASKARPLPEPPAPPPARPVSFVHRSTWLPWRQPFTVVRH